MFSMKKDFKVKTFLHVGDPQRPRDRVGYGAEETPNPPSFFAVKVDAALGGCGRGTSSSMTRGRPIWSPPSDCTGETRARFETGSSTCRPSRGADLLAFFRSL